MIQWNLHGFYNRSTDVQSILSNLHSNLIGLQETNIKIGQTAHLKNYTSYRRNRVNPIRASGGVVLYS